MKGIINDSFMLKSKTAKKLYSRVKDLPIIDYHCHLSPKMISENYKFRNVGELFLGGDHYKWRQMRTHGIEEKYITGDASDYEKFLKFAETVPYLIGNPIYHWTHLELKRYFGIDEPLTPESADRIWQRCNELLSGEGYGAQDLILKSGVEALCTTDDPSDDLRYHEMLKDFQAKVLPTFRPDKAVEIGNADFLPYISANGITDFSSLTGWIKSRIEYFDAHGCRLSDHGLGYVPYKEGDAETVFNKRLSGEILSSEEIDVYRTFIIRLCAKEYARLGWTMQIHFGALRNNSTRMFEKIGADTGFDSINDHSVAEPLSRLLDSLDREDSLPKTILYTLNPKDNYVLGTMIGNFQSAPTPAKVQFGSGWWFNDQRDGMENQMKSLANLGMLSHFVGMLTDSRSFVSYTRHEYFRRIVCNLIGAWVDDGEYPLDMETLKNIVTGICYKNAKEYFKF